MATSEPLLSVRDATKSYGDFPALRGLSVDLYPGEILGLLGPNGAGKTTLIRALSRRTSLDGGSISIATRQGIQALPGVVPQSLAVYEDLTAAQNLRVFGKLHGVPRKSLGEVVEQALLWSRLQDRQHHLVKTFSGGMKRRLNIACSIMHQPAILLLDEPTVGVDPQSCQRIYEMLDELRGKGTGVLLTTHQLDEAERRCDRIAIVDSGRVIQVGTFEDLVASTIGRRQHLRIHFRKPPTALPPRVELGDDGRVATCTLEDPTTDLASVISEFRADRDSIMHISLQGPTLQRVFLHLTGKELRE